MEENKYGQQNGENPQGEPHGQDAPQGGGQSFYRGTAHGPYPSGTGYPGGNDGYPPYGFYGQAPQYNYGQFPRTFAAAQAPAKPRMKTWKKVLIIVLITVLVVGGAGYGCAAVWKASGSGRLSDESAYQFGSPYVGILYLEGTISEGESGDGYNQQWMLARIDQMTQDKSNRGILLFVNTPGGSSYATVELYNALNQYKEETGKPIYVYMGSQATSGGYYASMAADKIYANPECWTGSIGVIVGSLIDYSGLLEKAGVKIYNFASGANKDMGVGYKAMTEEQKAIMQSLVDDSYDRFVAAVVAGRGLPEGQVRKLADGRIYSAAQAKENGLIDEIGSLQDAIDAMSAANNLENVDFQEISYTPGTSLFGDLLGFAASDWTEAGLPAAIKEMAENPLSVKLQYIAEIRK